MINALQTQRGLPIRLGQGLHAGGIPLKRLWFVGFVEPGIAGATEHDGDHVGQGGERFPGAGAEGRPRFVVVGVRVAVVLGLPGLAGE